MDEPPSVLLPCSICSRTFKPEVLQRHIKICEKAAHKKRRPFDSFKSRVTGTELEEFLGPVALPGQPIKRPEKSPQKKSVHSTPKWKETHETLIATLRAARGENDDNVNININKHAGNEQCPSCYRYFGPRAFDRHVEFCKEKTARIKTTPSKASQAHERLEARIKYRAPLSLKPKLTTKEKYSPMLPRKADSSEICSPSKSTSVNTAVKTSKLIAIKQNPSPNPNHFSRQSPTRISQRQRSVSPTKKSAVSNAKISTSKNELQIRQTNTPKIKDSLKETEDLRPKAGAKLTAQDKIRNLKPKKSRCEESCSRSKTRDGYVKHSDEESEDVKRIRDCGRSFTMANVKTTSSRLIFQTDIGQKNRSVKENKKAEDLLSDDETSVSSKSILSARNGSVRDKNSKQSPIINDLSVNDESFGIFVSPCSFGVKQPPPQYKPSTSTKPHRSKKPVQKIGRVCSPVKKETISEEINTVPKAGVSKIPKPKFKNLEKNEEEKIYDSNLFRKERERTATIRKKRFQKWRNLSEISNEDLEKMLTDFDLSSEFDDCSFKNDDSGCNEDLNDSAIWELAGEEFLKSEGIKYELEGVSERNKHDDIVVLHVADPSKLREQDTDPKLCVSEPCLSPCLKKDPVKIKSDVVVFTAVWERNDRESIRKRKKKKTKEIKIVPRACNFREKTFLANGHPQVKRRKLNSDEPSVTESGSDSKNLSESKNDSPIHESKGIEDENKSNKKFEYFEISKDVSESALNPPVEKKSPKAKKFEYFEIVDEILPKRFSGMKPKPKGLKVVKEPRNVDHSLQRKFRKDETNSSLENIQEAEEEEPSKCIEIEDFIISKPDKGKFLSRDEKCLDALFPKPKTISESVCKSESSTAVQLSFVVDSVYDLKPNDKKSLQSQKILKKRGRKDGLLPEITSIGNKDKKKENSIMSLVEIWKNKKETSETEYKKLKDIIIGTNCVKLAPLKNKTAVLPFVLRRKIAEVVVQIGCLERDKKDESYDPYKQAERQMMALLSWPSTVDLKNNSENKSSPPRLSPSRNLQTSPTSAFTKYPNKDGKITKDINENLNRTKNETLDKPNNREEPERTYTAADDWEEIFEKHFDLNRNEMSDKMTKSVKSALDGLLKKSPKKTDLSNFSVSTPQRNKTNESENSVIKDMIYTSTPKSADVSRIFRTPESKPKTPSTYRKISRDVYGRITPPDDFGDSIGKDNIENKSNRNSGISLSSLSFSSQVSDTTIADDEVLRNNLEVIGVATPRTAKRKFARSQSVFDERNKMLFAKTFDRNFSSSDENETDQSLPSLINKNFEIKNPLTTSGPFRFPRSQSVLDDRRKGDGDHSDDGDNVSSPETNKSRKAKMSGDSAYSSLNRKSPRPNVRPFNQHNDERLSSSGSENSLPPLNNEHVFKPKSLDFESLSGKKDQIFKMSKFCHECGSKYPVPIAKFCCECGVRRLII